MRIRTSFPCETFHEDIRVPLTDGTKLYARVWRPLYGEPVRPCSNTSRTG